MRNIDDYIKIMKDLYRAGLIGSKVIGYLHLRNKYDSLRGKKSVRVKHLANLMGVHPNTIYNAIRQTEDLEAVTNRVSITESRASLG